MTTDLVECSRRWVTIGSLSSAFFVLFRPVLGARPAIAAEASPINASELPPGFVSGLGNYGYDLQELYEALFRIQLAFKTGRMAYLSTIVHYPLLLNTSQKSINVTNGSHLAAYWSSLRNTIKDKVIGQRFVDLKYSGQGIPIGNGRIWLEPACESQACRGKKLMITTINDK